MEQVHKYIMIIWGFFLGGNFQGAWLPNVMYQRNLTHIHTYSEFVVDIEEHVCQIPPSRKINLQDIMSN